MAQYVNKDALVAEIEKRISRNKKRKEWEDIPEKRHQLIIEGQLLGELKHFLDTLEVKEVYLQKDSLTWKDINLIDHLLFDIKEDYDNGKLDKEKYYKEVLKKFKAQL